MGDSALVSEKGIEALSSWCCSIFVKDSSEAEGASKRLKET